MNIKYITLGFLSLIPFLCIAEDNAENNQFKADGEVGGHEYVDLKLPSKILWATCNLGSVSPYDTGDFFAWGETDARTNFSWENYKFFKGYESDENSHSYIVVEDLGDDISGTIYDAAAQEWGHGWRMPTYEECYELLMYCWSEWTTDEEVNGTRVHGRNENSIFLPAGGEYNDLNEIVMKGFWGNYWTGTNATYIHDGINIEPSAKAMCFFVDSSGLQVGPTWKEGGMNIRPVIDSKSAGIDENLEENPYVSMTYKQGMLRLDGNIEGCIIDIVDVCGKKIFQHPAKSDISLKDFGNGLFIVTLNKQGSVISTLKIELR